MFRYLLIGIIFFSITTTSYSQDSTLGLPEIEKYVIDSLYYTAILNGAPDIKAAEHRIERLDQILKREKKSWMDSFTFFFQVFEFDVDNDFERFQQRQDNVGTIGIFSNFSLNLRVDIGTIFQTKHNIGAAAADKKVAEAEKESAHWELRRWFIQQYSEYKLQIERARARLKRVETLREQMKLAEQRFKKGEIDLEEYFEWQKEMQEAVEAYQEAKLEAERIFLTIQSRSNL